LHQGIRTFHETDFQISFTIKNDKLSDIITRQIQSAPFKTFRAPKTAAAKAAQKVKPQIEDPLIDLGLKTSLRRKMSGRGRKMLGNHSANERKRPLLIDHVIF